MLGPFGCLGPVFKPLSHRLPHYLPSDMFTKNKTCTVEAVRSCESSRFSYTRGNCFSFFQFQQAMAPWNNTLTPVSMFTSHTSNASQMRLSQSVCKEVLLYHTYTHIRWQKKMNRHIKITHPDLHVFECVSITLTHQHAGLNSSLHPVGGDASQNGAGGKCNLSLNINFMRLSLPCWCQICFRQTIWQVSSHTVFERWGDACQNSEHLISIAASVKKHSELRVTYAMELRA